AVPRCLKFGKAAHSLAYPFRIDCGVQQLATSAVENTAGRCWVEQFKFRLWLPFRGERRSDQQSEREDSRFHEESQVYILLTESCGGQSCLDQCLPVTMRGNCADYGSRETQ